MIECAFKPGDLVTLVSEPRAARLERLVGQPSIVTDIDDTFSPPRVIVAVFDPRKKEMERIRCRTEDLKGLSFNR
ncbi:MAG: hypothetical protein JWM80_780 [Cyanobacteria bacterium RYN_339]|nr:hypothetical protein [Cyanobacteria bacterium RYN_339]